MDDPIWETQMRHKHCLETEAALKGEIAELRARIEELREELWVVAERLEARGHNMGADAARRA